MNNLSCALVERFYHSSDISEHFLKIDDLPSRSLLRPSRTRPIGTTAGKLYFCANDRDLASTNSDEYECRETDTRLGCAASGQASEMLVGRGVLGVQLSGDGTPDVWLGSW